MHVQPEITVEGMAFDYQDQASTLTNILASLPADMDLVVKEHSPMLGYRPLETYNQLVHTPGLIIADTKEDSHDLITNASVVVTYGHRRSGSHFVWRSCDSPRVYIL